MITTKRNNSGGPLSRPRWLRIAGTRRPCNTGDLSMHSTCYIVSLSLYIYIYIYIYIHTYIYIYTEREREILWYNVTWYSVIQYNLCLSIYIYIYIYIHGNPSIHNGIRISLNTRGCPLICKEILEYVKVPLYRRTHLSNTYKDVS